MPEPQINSSDPFAAVPNTMSEDAGTYLMTDMSGKTASVPLESIGSYGAQGYSLNQHEKERYTTDYAKKYGLTVGRNAGGDPILLNPNDATKSWWDRITHGLTPSAMADREWRFIKGGVGEAYDAAKGTLQALTLPPQNKEEAEMAKGSLPGTLAFYRMTLEPVRREREKAEQLKKEIEARGGSIHNFNDPDVQLYWKHLTIGQIPIAGPMVAEGAEGIGKSLAAGDIAGGSGKAVTQAVLLYGLVDGADAAEGIVKQLPAKTAAELRTEIPFVPTPIKKAITEKLPHGMVTRMIRPGKAQYRFGKDPAQAILDEGITGNNLEEIGNKVSDRLAATGQEIDRLVQSPVNAGKIVDVSPAIQVLDDAMNKAVNGKDTALFEKLKGVKAELTHNWMNFFGQMVPTGRMRPRMSPYQAIQFKRIVGDRVRWTGEPLEGQVNQALGEMYGKIKELTNAKVDGLAKLNEHYADLVGAAKSIRDRIPAENRNAHWSLSDIALAGTHHVPLAFLRHALRYPAIRSRLAVALHGRPPGGYPINAGKPAPVMGDLMRGAAKATGASGIANADQLNKTAAPSPATAPDPFEGVPNTLPPAEPAASAPEAVAPPSVPEAAAQPSDLNNIVSQAATTYNVDPALIAAVIGQESGGNPTIVSGSGAIGMMQLMPETAKQYGVTDPTNPTQNIMGGTHYLHDLLAKHNGNVEEALKDYYGRGVPPIDPKTGKRGPTTEEYARSVMAKLNSAKGGQWASLLPVVAPTGPPPLPGLTGRTIAGIPLVKLPDSARKGAVPPMISETMATATPPQGMIAPGNIPIWKRPVVQNDDGSHSSELSVSFADEYEGSPYYRKEVLVPLIADGRFLTPDGKMPKGGPPKDWSKASPEWKDLLAKAKNRYYNTGEMLGVFEKPEDADRYSDLLHSRETRQRPPMQDYAAYSKPPAPAAAAPTPTVAQVSIPTQTPGKKYRVQMVGANGHRIGSDDGVNWFDITTGKLFPVNVKMKPRAGKPAAAGQ